MENNKKRNPNSHECLNSWSELPLDLLNMVFKRLGFADFQRAKSVCSSWLSASKQSTPKKKHTPWLILFPEDDSKQDNFCTLFNPEEKEALYKTQDTVLDYAKSVCKATYGSWLLLMHDLSYNLHIVNLFTKQIIILLPMESQLGMTKEKGTKPKNRIISSVLWIDEKAKDYIVLCNVDKLRVVYKKKVNKSWKKIPETSQCYDMVYKDHKLYFLNDYGDFNIFDLYGEVPQHTLRRGLIDGVQSGQINSRLSIYAIKLVATVTGDVLVVQKIWRSIPMTWSFLVIKFYSSGNMIEHQLVNSLGNESMLFDQGITVHADETDGVIANSIYFSGCDDEKDRNDLFLFNLKTQKTELIHKFDCSSVQFSRAQWFLPSFTHA